MIRSPIAGTVVEKLISPGQLLQAGTTPCFTVADLSRVWVMAQIFGPISPRCTSVTGRMSNGIGCNGSAGTVTNVRHWSIPTHAR